MRYLLVAASLALLAGSASAGVSANSAEERSECTSSAIGGWGATYAGRSSTADQREPGLEETHGWRRLAANRGKLVRQLAERTRDTDLDRDQRLDEAKKDAERSLVTIDTDIPTAGVAQDKLDAYKGFLRSDAYAILGTLAYNAKAFPDAEANLRKSIDAFPQSVDPIAVFRLALALDMQGKYPEAVKYCNQAVDLRGTNEIIL